MTEQEKTQAILMRCRGIGYRAIGVVLGFSENTARRGLIPGEKRRHCKQVQKWYATKKNDRAYKERNRQRAKAWHEANKERHRARSCKWAKDNPERMNARSSAWRKANRDKVNPGHRRRARKENMTINGYLARQLRIRLRNALQGKTKKGSAVRDLGCSITDFRKYLESKFQPGMTWENWTHDGWHIDHIQPLASFNLEEINELRKACHYTNLQPLWAGENLRKGAQI